MEMDDATDYYLVEADKVVREPGWVDRHLFRDGLAEGFDLNVAGACRRLIYFNLDNKATDRLHLQQRNHWQNEYELLQDELEEAKELVEHYRECLRWYEDNAINEEEDNL